MNRAQWLEQRRSGIGSSDVAAICGLSPWRTALDVYCEKIAPPDAPQPAMNPAMEWGHRLEPVIAQAYADTTGAALAIPAAIEKHATKPFMLASLDREWADKSRIVECKSTSERMGGKWGEPGTDDIPEMYLLQVQHQLAVTGLAVADVAVLVGTHDFRIYTVRRHAELIAQLEQMEEDFWKAVLCKEPPQPDWKHPNTLNLIRNMFGVSGDIVELTGECELHAARYNVVREQIGKLEAEKKELQAKLMFLMGEAPVAHIAGGFKASRRWVKRKGYTVPEGDYLRFALTMENKNDPA